jgi:DNA mismatch repair protein MutS
LDILKCHAKNAIQYNLVKPTINHSAEQSFIRAKGLRHPIVEQLQTKTPFIANDITLGTDGQNMVLCYGYNAVGKTTKQKAICISAIMAQMGGFVSASEYEYYPYRYIFTRISNVDNLLKNQSSFMVEMMELKYILKHADKYSLVCIDELVASTERFSGVALVASTIHELYQRQSSMFMATHLHELAQMPEITKIPTLGIYHLEVHYDERSKTLVYDRKLREGPGTGLYGLEVARFLELDPAFMERAFAIRNEILGAEAKVFVATQSKYNNQVFLSNCRICGYKPIHGTDQPLETHHINFQCNADADGNFADKGFHKDIEHNLISLCRACHQKVHQGHVEIQGYQATGSGIQLKLSTEPEISDSINSPDENLTKTRKRLDTTDIQTIKDVVQQNLGMKKKDIIQLLREQHNICVDYKRLASIHS